MPHFFVVCFCIPFLHSRHLGQMLGCRGQQAAQAFRLPPCPMQVYLATLNETLVALKLLVSADQPALNSEESGSWLSPGSPVMQALHKVGRCMPAFHAAEQCVAGA